MLHVFDQAGISFIFINSLIQKDFVMTQFQLEHAVARATGESIETIRRHGFIAVTIRFPRLRRKRRRCRTRISRALRRCTVSRDKN